MHTSRTNTEAEDRKVPHPGGHVRYTKLIGSFRWNTLRVLLEESFAVWQRHNGSRLAASLSFYTLLSLTPLLVIVVSIAGLVFCRQAAQSQLFWQIQALWWVSREQTRFNPCCKERATPRKVFSPLYWDCSRSCSGRRFPSRASRCAQHHLGGPGADTVRVCK